MDKKELKKFVNKILQKKGIEPVQTFSKEFADGSKLLVFQMLIWWFVVMYQNVFNALFDEKIDCKLKPSNLLEERILNWNRINCKFKMPCSDL